MENSLAGVRFIERGWVSTTPKDMAKPSCLVELTKLKFQDPQGLESQWGRAWVQLEERKRLEALH